MKQRLYIIMCNKVTTMLQRLYILIYECNEATAMLQRLYIVNYNCNEATVLLHRLDKKQIKHKFSSNRLPAHHSSQDKDPILLNNTHTCTSLPHSFCMDFQEHFFPFLLQSSACTRGFQYRYTLACTLLYYSG